MIWNEKNIAVTQLDVSKFSRLIPGYGYLWLHNPYFGGSFLSELYLKSFQWKLAFTQLDVSQGVSQGMEIYGCITAQGSQPILQQDDDEVDGDDDDNDDDDDDDADDDDANDDADDDTIYHVQRDLWKNKKNYNTFPLRKVAFWHDPLYV